VKTMIPPNTKASTGSLRLLAIGVDHRSATVELREKVYYDNQQAQELLAKLVASDDIDEACLLSTCNRTELYLKPTGDTAKAYRTGLELAFLQRASEIEDEGRFFVKRDELAARHLLEVASGLQSMVLGEPEILGQVKQATGLAETAGATGQVLQKLLRTAIATGGRARSETAIGHGAVSFGYAVVDLARNIFQSLDTCSVLMLGAGEMARIAARSLTERGTRDLTVANRSLERAEAFREVFPEARIVPFADRRQALADCDIAVASTSAKENILSADDVAFAMKQRRTRPLLLADLGMPRNIDSGAATIGNVFLQDIDSLRSLIERNLKRRREEIPRVQEILDRELGRFGEWHRGQASEPVVARLQKMAEKLRRSEVEAVRDRFPEETHAELERLTRSLVRKLLHHPSKSLRGAAADGTIDFVRDLFRLDDEEPK
jgi:glutamyl-tRNA reductase